MKAPGLQSSEVPWFPSIMAAIAAGLWTSRSYPEDRPSIVLVGGSLSRACNATNPMRAPSRLCFGHRLDQPLGSFEKDKRHGARAGPPLFAELAGLPAYKAPPGLARRRTNIFLKVVASSVAHSDDVIPPGGQQRLCSGNGSLCSGNGRCARRLYMRPRDPGWCAWMRPPNN
jgi:hypothetical protein